MSKGPYKLIKHPKSEEKTIPSTAVIAEISEVLNRDDNKRHSYDPDLLINLDFRRHPDLLHVLRKLSDKQFRSIQQQIMFILNEFCLDFIYEKKKK